MNEEALKKDDKKDLSHKIKFSSFIGKPTPIDFDAFVPWICLELQVPYKITVFRTIQEAYISRHKRHSLVKSNKTEQRLNEVTKKSLPNKDSAKISKPNNDDSIPVTSYYNTKGHLIEIAIVGSPFEIPRKLIIAFTLCIPFHTSLGKISIRKGKINFGAIQAISNLLPHSNITEVFLENCCVPEGKYHLLLDHTCLLKNLALRRMGIDDVECRNIVEKLDVGQTASKSLLTLDLSSNKLTDESARALGEILRRNRCLLHLNVCDNKISDVGADCILKSLTAFPLTDQEIFDKKRRRFEYLIKRIAFYKQSKDDLLFRQNKKEDEENKQDINKCGEWKKRTTDTMSSTKGNTGKGKKSPSSSTKSELTINELAEKITKDNIGKYIDVFDDENLIMVKKRQYSIGNLRLCSLNLSYNNLSYLSVRKIYEVLDYQRNALPKKPHLSTGLMRILIEGNNVPDYCHEYKDINIFLDRVVSENCRAVSAGPNSTHSAPSLKSLSKRSSAPSVKHIGRSSAHMKKQ